MEDSHNNAKENGLLHGTTVMRHLVLPWAHSNRVVCAYSYFAAVVAAVELVQIGLRFIGVVKTVMRQFPMPYLSQQELRQHGDRKDLLSLGPNGKPTILAFVWMDRDHHYFIAAVASLDSGKPFIWKRWRQVNQDDPDAELEFVTLTVPQPKAGEHYYDTCAMIDQHN